MPICKKCSSDKNIKSGKVNNKQRYECKGCGCRFVEGDDRTNDKIQSIHFKSDIDLNFDFLQLFYSLNDIF